MRRTAAASQHSITVAGSVLVSVQTKARS